MSPRSQPSSPSYVRARPGPDDLRRTFEAVPPRTSHGDEPFADTWWGRSWVAALESCRWTVARPRPYLRRQRPCRRHHRHPRPRRRLRPGQPRPSVPRRAAAAPLTDTGWDTFLDAVAARPGHLAALLAKEMPHTLVDTAAETGTGLLPAANDLDPSCSCPDHGWPCKHVAALCYQMARLLDTDPFVLLLLRGRGERELVEELVEAERGARCPGTPQGPRHFCRRRRAKPWPTASSRRCPPRSRYRHSPASHPRTRRCPAPAIRSPWTTSPRTRPPARMPSSPPARTPSPGSLPGRTPSGWPRHAPPPDSPPPPAPSTGNWPSPPAAPPPTWPAPSPPGARAAPRAWRSWKRRGTPRASPFDRARPALAAADFPRFQPWRNHLTHPGGTLQLRFGHDGRWYGYESDRGKDDWWPRAMPDVDPVGALTALLGR